MKYLFMYAFLYIGLIIPNKNCYANSMENKEKFHNILSDYKEFYLRTNPESATYDGDYRFNDKLSDLSDKAEHAKYDSLRTFLLSLQSVDESSLKGQDKLTYTLFKEQLEETIEGQIFNWHYMPLTQQDGIHLYFPQLIESHPFKSINDYHTYIQRLKLFSIQVDQVIENMNFGIKAKLVSPAFSIKQILAQITPFISQDIDSLPFTIPLKSLDGIVKKQDQIIIKDLIIQALKNYTIPAYKKLYAYLETEYLPHARNTDGIYSLPDGKERYAYAIKQQTTTTLHPDEIYSLGLKEVQRITALMEEVKNELNFTGDLAAFNSYLLQNAAFKYTDKDSMLKDYREILSKVDKQLIHLFGRLPKAKYALKEMENYRAASAPQAYYYSAPLDRSRPGYFYVNTYDLASRPKHTMTALALHEAVPGHHLQISLAQELSDMPWVRTQMGYNAFVEGWALYAESLGYEMNMYSDTIQKYGSLTFEMWRACRLVVDAGIHTGKMTREQGVQFMLEHTGNSELDTRSEIDRYIVWPGQALAYKIGQLAIIALRKEAQDTLGTQFSLSDFHDAVLENGAIPLHVLQQHMHQWMKAQKNN